jgi:hypothetical protein
MYWTILVNIVPDLKDGMLRSVFDYSVLDTRWGDEARFRFDILSGNANRGLIRITVYDVKHLWYKKMNDQGDYADRCDDDVLVEIKDHLFYCGHDVIGCQRHEGNP